MKISLFPNLKVITATRGSSGGRKRTRHRVVTLSLSLLRSEENKRGAFLSDEEEEKRVRALSFFCRDFKKGLKHKRVKNTQREREKDALF